MPKDDFKPVTTNKKAYHDFFIEETFETGIELTGTEVKSLRENKASLRESFATVRGGEVWLHVVPIAPYSHGNRINADPDRQRKLLLQSGVEVLRHLDDLNRSMPAPASVVEGAATAALEAVVSSPDTTLSDEDLEELIARRRTARKEKTGGFCPKCGKPFLQSDKFCSCCGEPVGMAS